MVFDDILRDPESAPYVRRWFFERLTAGLIPPGQIPAEARRLDLDLEAEQYALALFDLPPEPGSAAQYLSDPAALVRSTVIAYFLKYSEYVLFNMGPTLRAVLIKGSRLRMPGLIQRCVDTVGQLYGQGGLAGWHIAVSSPVPSLAALPGCWEEVCRLWGWRYVQPWQQVFLPGADRPLPGPEDAGCLAALDPAAADTGALTAFLQRGRPEEAPAFAQAWLDRLAGAGAFSPLRHWAMLSALLAARRAMPEAEDEALPAWDETDPARYIAQVLAAAAAWRDRAGSGGLTGPMAAAMDCLHAHFADPGLTLEQTARQAGLSPAYLSALFHRTLGVPFSRYLTDRRMEQARRLLAGTDMAVGAVGRACGYRDGHYFSALFKKTQGCSPTQYRAQHRQQKTSAG